MASNSSQPITRAGVPLTTECFVARIMPVRKVTIPPPIKAITTKIMAIVSMEKTSRLPQPVALGALALDQVLGLPLQGLDGGPHHLELEPQQRVVLGLALLL